MPNRSITLTFEYEINNLVQVGDVVYYQDGTTIKEMGLVTAVDFTNKTITCNIPVALAAPTTSQFIFFSKDNKPHQTDIIGYYAKCVMKNDSPEAAELFQVGGEVAESSK